MTAKIKAINHPMVNTFSKESLRVGCGIKQGLQTKKSAREVQNSHSLQNTYWKQTAPNCELYKCCC